LVDGVLPGNARFVWGFGYNGGLAGYGLCEGQNGAIGSVRHGRGSPPTPPTTEEHPGMRDPPGVGSNCGGNNEQVAT